MINFHGRKLLVIAPHPDDEVIGCGGLMRKVKQQGGEVYVLYLVVSHSQDFSKKGFSTADERMQEIQDVSDMLQVDGWHVAFPGEKYHLQLDHIPQKQLIHAIEKGNDISFEGIKPDIVAFPLFGDYNQDHRAAAQAGFAACRPAPREEKYIPNVILSYEAPMSSWAHTGAPPQMNFFVELEQNFARDKSAAMSMYKSQVRGPGHPRNESVLEAFAAVRGSAIGVPYAEGFHCYNFRT